MTALWIAVQFLTRLPVALKAMPTAEQVGRSLLWYPLVGLLIGAVLCLLQAGLEGAPALLQAALLLAVWVGISGGLHLDGLADSADAWAGGFGDPERSLAIMKDPRSGPVAVVVLVLLLLIKFAALVTLIEAGQGAWLVVVPWIGRGALPLLFMVTPYVRVAGLGQALSEHLPRRGLAWVLPAHVLAMLVWGGAAALAALLAAALLFFGLRRLMLRRLGGTTGDTAGALVELSEAAALLALALVA